MSEPQNTKFTYCIPDHYFEGYVSIKPRYSTIFWKHEYFGDVKGAPKDFTLPTSNKENGMLSEKATSRVTTAVNWLVELADEKKFVHPTKLNVKGNPLEVKFKIAFITLTLPSKQVHSDNEILEQCLQPFIKKLVERFGTKVVADNKNGFRYVLNYIWKAEKQTIDNYKEDIGNIHFHITIDKFIWHAEIRDLWNMFIERIGYVSAYRDKMLNFHKDGFTVREDLLVERDNGKHNTKKVWSLEDQKQAYERGCATGWMSPNSTDIHSVQKIKDLARYISKYVAKNPLTDIERKDYEIIIEDKLKIDQGFHFELPAEYDNLDLGFRAKCLKYLDAINERMKIYRSKIVTCRIWDCSQSLEKIKLVLDIDENLLDGEFFNVIQTEEYKKRKIQMDASREPNPFFLIVPFSVQELKAIGAKKIAAKYDEFISQKKKEFADGTLRRSKNEGKTIELPTVYASDMAA